MKKIIIEFVLGVVIIGLGIWLYISIMEPVKFDNEYTKRRDACAEKLKAIRTLEEAYNATYGCYCGSFDTLVNRLLNEDSMKVVGKTTNYDRIPADVDINEVTELEAIRMGYVTRTEVLVNPIRKYLEDGKFPYLDPDGLLKNKENIEITDAMREALENLRYVPYPKGSNLEFQLQAGTIDRGGFTVPVFECLVNLKDLLSDMDHQLVINKISELENINRFPGWKVGDMTQSITDGNFE
ncbi:MAG: hypothetical protein KBT04_03495 [Bacteroidales bacterium]|nr:hypothetical protein [Candidatus Colimorpha onthohippi]